MEIRSLVNVGAPLELAGILPANASQKTPGAGDVVAQAACSIGIARGGVEKLGAEGNPVFPGSASAAGIVAVFQTETEDHATRIIFVDI